MPMACIETIHLNRSVDLYCHNLTNVCLNKFHTKSPDYSAARSNVVFILRFQKFNFAGISLSLKLSSQNVDT